MNRRSFFQAAAAMSIVAPLHGSPASPAIASRPHPALAEVDIADHDAMTQGAGRNTQIFARLQEMNPADQGELSGAVLRILDGGNDIGLNAELGDTIQRGGYRTHHLLGWLDADDTIRIASRNPDTEEEDFSVCFHDSQDQAYSRTWLSFCAGKAPELRLEIAGHCLGVLRGKLLVRFFDCLRMRARTVSETI
jgi:hypothetical protein